MNMIFEFSKKFRTCQVSDLSTNLKFKKPQGKIKWKKNSENGRKDY